MSWQQGLNDLSYCAELFLAVFIYWIFLKKRKYGWVYFAGGSLFLVICSLWICPFLVSRGIHLWFFLVLLLSWCSAGAARRSQSGMQCTAPPAGMRRSISPHPCIFCCFSLRYFQGQILSITGSMYWFISACIWCFSCCLRGIWLKKAAMESAGRTRSVRWL